MFPATERPRVFGLPPGADFPAALVAGLRARMAGQPPEAMARVTLYLNTARMRERVRAAFRQGGPAILPRLVLLGEVGAAPLPGIAPPIPPLRRQLELVQLVGGLLAREPEFAAGTAVYDLAESLAELLDEMQDQGVPASAFDLPGLAEDHATHWERSLTFLRIIAPFLDEGAAPGPAARQRIATARLLAEWAVAPAADPVVVAGSTGSRGTTAMLMEAVARLPQGALVLPGFDFDMPDFGWNSLFSGRIPDEDHPQFRLARLLKALALAPGDVRPWGGEAPDPGRNRLISLALRPAPVTDQWLSEGAALGDIGTLANGLSLIEAPTPRAEASAIALALREAVERGQSAALVTSDRTLARRVTAALDRWGITPDDSAGEPLPLTAPGRLLRHVAALFGRTVTAEALLILLKHPLTATGGERGNHLRFTRDLELFVRRRGLPFPDAEDLAAWARAEGEPERIAWADWLAHCLALVPVTGEALLTEQIARLTTLAEALAAGPGGEAAESTLWQRAAGRQARAAIDGLTAEAAYGGAFSAGAFGDLLAATLNQDPVREVEPTHPGITILGTREARELQSDLVILAGLNEGVWPQPTAPDPWLSRQMRLRMGLLLPERQIGLSAHDFQQAAGGPLVILSRALRDDEAQTVPSRWLDRLTNLIAGLDGEAGAIAAMRIRGARWIDLAADAERVVPTAPARRPAPRPPVEARPRELPVTAITRLIRDPYAVYARYILRLRPLDPIRPEPDALARGRLLHRMVEKFVGERRAGETLPEARARLVATAEAVLVEDAPWPAAQRLWLARIARIADSFVAAEAKRMAEGEPAILEERAGIDLPGLSFRLTARPDRIDQREDGSLHIYDYKSGKPPTGEQIRHFEKQLPLEAAMAERGAFAAVGPQPVQGMTFVQLGGDGQSRFFARDEFDLDDEWARLQRLIGRYRRHEQGYAARRAVFKAEETGDYDHLARFGEWQQSDLPAPEDVPEDAP